MKRVFRITEPLLKSIHLDLSRPHQFALERVGFIVCRNAQLDGSMVFLAESYVPVDDNDYVDNPKAGATMGPVAIRKALQIGYNDSVSMFHVHRHEHYGRPAFSRLDLRESAKFIPDFWKVQPKLSHGALVLSHDEAYALAWDPVDRLSHPINEFTVVGRPLRIFGK